MNRTGQRLNALLAMIVVLLVAVIGGLLLLDSGSRPRSASATPAQVILESPVASELVPWTSTVAAQAFPTSTPSAGPPPVQTVASPSADDLRQVPSATSQRATPTVAYPTPPVLQLITPAAGPVALGVSLFEQVMPEGMFLTVSAPELPVGYRLGPLARGSYVLGPNGVFLIYVANYGQVFALRLGDRYFTRITSLKRQLSAVSRDDEPLFHLSIYDGKFAMFLIVEELVYGQRISVRLPREITY